MKSFFKRLATTLQIAASAYPLSILAFFCLVFSVTDIHEAAQQSVAAPMFAFVELGIAIVIGGGLVIYGYHESKRAS